MAFSAARALSADRSVNLFASYCSAVWDALGFSICPVCNTNIEKLIIIVIIIAKGSNVHVTRCFVFFVW